MISVRPPRPHSISPILTGKSQNLPKAKTEDAAGRLEETGRGGKSDHGAKMLALGGKKSAEMMMTLEETATQDCSEATETTTDRGPDPDHRLHADALLEETMRTETERWSTKI